ncbi:MFS general substrate transporter [Xylariaceae sp. FL1019]|nr:MFS general substrate transporter [Xylariaceae sp. FL1019]
MSTLLVQPRAENKENNESTVVSTAASTTSLENNPPLGEPAEKNQLFFSRISKTDRDAIATQPSVFDDPETAEKYHPPQEWENYHRFDTKARWTWGEESAVIRKIDLRIMIWVCLMAVALELDRQNLITALTDDFLQDLKLTTDDYNLGNTAFRAAFLVSELPSQLLSKWIGPDRWIPIQITLWSLVTGSQFFLSGRSSFVATRALLGVLQGGFIPDIILYLSYFYKSHELTIRLGIFWSVISFGDVFTSLFGAGILRLRGHLGYAGWQWLFLLEGIITILVGLFSFVLMPAGPCQTANWFRGKSGWFTEREETIMVNRVIRDDPSKSDMHNREPITLELLWNCLTDFDLWPVYLLGLVHQIPATPPTQYFTLVLRSLKFTTLQTNLLTIPTVLVHAISVLGLTYLAEIVDQLSLVASLGQIWMLPFLTWLAVVDLGEASRWTQWAILTLLLGYPLAHAIQTSWISRNSNSVRLRTVSAALYNIFVQASTIIGSNVYHTSDAPYYHKGNKQLLAILAGNIVFYALTKLYYVWRNKQRDQKWNAMTPEEQLNYVTTTTDKGNKRLEFRFKH